MAANAKLDANGRTVLVPRVRPRLGACVVLVLLAGITLVAAPAPVAAIPPVGIISTYAAVPDITQSIAIKPNGDVIALWHSGRSFVDRINPDGSTTPLVGGDGCELEEPPQQGLTLCYALAMASGPDGSLYLTSNYDNKIWRIWPDNTITKFAGVGGITFGGYSGDGGPSTSAMLSRYLFGITVDDAGNVYFGDGPRVRKVDTNGIITTIAGGGTENPGDGGPATEAGFWGAEGIAIDVYGNVYFTETSRVRKVNADGIISTVAGTGTNAHSGDGGPAVSADLFYPSSLIFDAGGNLLILSGGNRIRAIDGSGVIETIAGTGVDGYSGDGGLATDAYFQSGGPLSLDPDGDLYMTQWRAKIRRITWQGSLAGTLRDVSGVGVEGVVVSVLDAATGLEVASTASAGDGSWWVKLPPGLYNVFFDASAAGMVSEFFNDAYGEVDAEDVVVEMAQETTADAMLSYVCTPEGGPGPFTDVGADHRFCEVIEWLAAEGITDGYSDGSFVPTKPLTRQGIAAFLAAALGDGSFVAPGKATFPDVPVGHPFFVDVEWLAAEGITDGYSDGSFGPTKPLSRQAIAAMLRAALDGEGFVAPSKATFPDVPVGHPFFVDVEWLAAQGITDGYSDGSFGPTKPLTRQGIAAFLAAALIGVGT